jgi:hypothetical protein
MVPGVLKHIFLMERINIVVYEEEQNIMQQNVLEKPAALLEHPRRRDVFFHALKTAHLIKDLLVDSRIPVIRKLLFFASVAAFLVILIFPDALSETFLSIVLPVVGTVLGVPLDLGFDWIAFALAIVGLIRFFPPEIVSEHYRQIFHGE